MKTTIYTITLGLLLLAKPAFSQMVLTIDKAIELAMQQSPDMKQVQLSLKRSQENLNAQRAALKSNFSLTLDPIEYRKENTLDARVSKWYYNERLSSSGNLNVVQPILPTDGILTLNNNAGYTMSSSEEETALGVEIRESKRFTNNLSLGIDQPIFTYNRLKVTLLELELDVENSYLNYGLQKLNVEQNVSSQFYQVYQNQQALEISKEELKNTQESFDIIKSKVDGGLQALEELYQAELNLASSQSTVRNTEVTLQNSIDNLCVALDLPFDTDIIIMASIEAKSADISLKKATDLALTNRAELRQREIDLQLSKNGMLSTKAENEFSGSISAGYGIEYGQDLDTKVSNTKTTPYIGIQLDIPLYDWGEQKAKIKAQQASIDMSQLSMQNEKRSIILSVRSTVRSLDNLLTQIDIQKKTLKNAELTYDINLERYKNGDLTGMDLSLFQNQLSNAKISLTNAIIDYKLGLLDLKVQTLYDFTKQESIVPEEFKMTMIKK